MSLSSAVAALATRVGEEFKAVRAELVSGLAGKAASNDARLTDNRVPAGWVEAAKFGALGDNTTDDTTALQAAVNALPASGGTLHLAPNSTYVISAALVAKPYGLIIDGNNSAIRMTSTSASAITGVDITGLVLRDLTIIGPGSGSGSGIKLTRSVNASTPSLSFERVVVRSFGADGIELSNPITSTFTNVECRQNFGHGWNVHGVSGGAAGTSCAFVAAYADGNAKAGFRLDTMTYCAFTGCAADHNGRQYELINCQGITFSGTGCETPVAGASPYLGDSWYFTGCFGIVLDACWSYGALTTSIDVQGNTKGVVVKGFAENTPQAGATHCVRTTAGTRVTIVDCNNTRPYSLAPGTTSILNDGGGLSVPGYVYGASTAYFEGEVGTSNATPSYDGSLTPRGWVTAQLAGKAPLTPVVRTQAFSATPTLDPTVPGNLVNLTATADITALAVSTTGATDRQTLEVAILASGGARNVTFATAIRTSTGITRGAYAVPSGQVLVAGLKYSTLISAWVLVAATISAT